jgi:hypothetical protein
MKSLFDFQARLAPKPAARSSLHFDIDEVTAGDHQNSRAAE